MPLSIYLADLTHDGAGKPAVDMMPYNIGLVASFAKKHLGPDNVSLETYKQVNEILLRQGCVQKAEVIVPLPGETYQRFQEGPWPIQQD